MAAWNVMHATLSCSSTVASRTLSLWLRSAQLLKQQLAEHTSCLALAGSHLLNIVVLSGSG